MTPFSRLRGPGRVMNSGDVPQQRDIWKQEIQPTPFVGRTRNKANRVIIDDDSITVIGSGGTVVIDGNSDMFRIIASGSRTATTSNGDDNVTDESTLTALGTFTATPSHLSYVTIQAGNTGSRNIGMYTAMATDFVATTSGGAVTASRVVATLTTRAYTLLNGSDQARIGLVFSNTAAGNQTIYQRYYILEQVAI